LGNGSPFRNALRFVRNKSRLMELYIAGSSAAVCGLMIKFFVVKDDDREG
jgi:hypothetical protein